MEKHFAARLKLKLAQPGAAFAGLSDQQQPEKFQIKVLSENLVSQSSSLIVRACEKVAGVGASSALEKKAMKLSVVGTLADQPCAEHVLHYGGSAYMAPPPSSSSSSASSVPTPSAAATDSSASSATPVAVPVSSDELLFVRATLSLCNDTPITAQFRSRQFLQAERAKSALALLSFLQEHRVNWHIHPAEVSERLEKRTDVAGIGTDPIPSPVEEDADAVVNQVRTVLLPVSVDIHPSHVGAVARSLAQTKHRTKVQQNYTPQEIAQHQESKQKKDAQAASLGCVHSA